MPDRKARHLSYSVMVIDDDETIRRLLQIVLGRTWAFHVLATVGSAREAFDILENPSFPRPEVILLDYLMPEMDGWEAVPRLRELSPTSQIIMATVVPDRCKELAENHEIDGCLDKSLLPAPMVFRLYQLLHPSTTFTHPEDLDAEAVDQVHR